ncbi:MAG: Rossmann-like domain-containing protein [Eggerthella lenta]
MKRSENEAVRRPDTRDDATPWKLYNRLIEGIPEDIAVRDYCLGMHWSYVEADCGMGVSFTCKGGARRACKQDLRGTGLREMAELAKSWCFEEATLGVAALNAYYARKELLDPLGATYDEPIELPDGTVRKMDAFELYRPRIEASERKNVTVVGHFPHVDRIAEYANLTVLERNCSQELDTPDPACEYVLPDTDFAFITGVTIINKTAPRLLELARNATTVLVGERGHVVGPVRAGSRRARRQRGGRSGEDPFRNQERCRPVLRRGFADDHDRTRPSLAPPTPARKPYRCFT